MSGQESICICTECNCHSNSNSSDCGSDSDSGCSCNCSCGNVCGSCIYSYGKHFKATSIYLSYLGFYVPWPWSSSSTPLSSSAPTYPSSSPSQLTVNAFFHAPMMAASLAENSSHRLHYNVAQFEKSLGLSMTINRSLKRPQERDRREIERERQKGRSEVFAHATIATS